jgi:hypothetical protein
VSDVRCSSRVMEILFKDGEFRTFAQCFVSRGELLSSIVSSLQTLASDALHFVAHVRDV